MVGRLLLVGGVGGLGFSLLFGLPGLASPVLGFPAPAPWQNLSVLSSGWARAGSLLLVLQGSLLTPVVVFLGVLLCRVVFRRMWLAYLMVHLIVAVFAAASAGSWTHAVEILPAVTLMLILLTRFGLLALLVAMAFSSWSQLPLTADPSSWIFPGSAWTMAFFAAVAIYGFVVSLGGQKLFKNAIEA